MVDSVKIILKAGKGGDGAVTFRREKFIPKGGPDGGDGGRGGSIYIQTDPNLSTLMDFAHKQNFKAQEGGKGMKKKMSGKAGADLVLKVPVGTEANLYSEEGYPIERIDFDKPGLMELVAKGGKGGRGNEHFKSSTNTTPMEAEPGKPGQSFSVTLELKLLADIGLVGLPNVGKSTILSVLSNARPKIADYEFTTLEPNLGVMKYKDVTAVIADIPGLVEGANEGKGLGREFLRHIERTRVLVHVLAAGFGEEDTEVERVWGNYQVIREELKGYGKHVDEKPEIVVLNKTDLISEELTKKIVQYFKKKKVDVMPISAGSNLGIEKLKGKILSVGFTLVAGR